MSESECAFLSRIADWGKKVVICLNKKDIVSESEIKDVEEYDSLPKAVHQEFNNYVEERRPPNALPRRLEEHEILEEFNKWQGKRKQEFAARWAADAAKLGYPDYRHGIVMDMADRNLLSAIQQESMPLETTRAMLRALVACVGHVHGHGRVHAGAVPCLSLRPLVFPFSLLEMHPPRPPQISSP